MSNVLMQMLQAIQKQTSSREVKEKKALEGQILSSATEYVSSGPKNPEEHTNGNLQ